MWNDDDDLLQHFAAPPEPPSHLRPVPPELEGAYPDLLHPRPALNLDVMHAQANFRLAFEAGDTNRSLAGALDEAPLAPSTWGEIDCARELFLDDFIAHCMRPRFTGAPESFGRAALTRLIANPPSDLATVEFRRTILATLANDRDARQRFEQLYLELRALREAFESDEPLAELDSRRRRLWTLQHIHRTFASMTEAFVGSTEGLERISAYAARVVASPGYRRLSELLEHERELATVELRVQIGAEGYVNEFEVVRVHERRDNPFYRTPLVRALQKLSLWLRGYHASNTVLLARWFMEVFTGVEAYLPPLLQLLGAMEFYLAALAFRERCAARGLAVCFPSFVEPDASAPPLVRGLFNPLLLAQGQTPVSCDLRFEPEASATIVTGPNSGGKTRLLQAIAYTQLLGQAGMFAPAAAARLRPASALFVSLIEQAQFDQREGRLGTELLRIRALFEHARPGVLVLLDELCSGTNPQEGEEIFRLVLGLLEQLDARVFVATHFLSFAQVLRDGPGRERRSFLQVELGPDRLPTYQFVPGVADSSLAAQTARRLGVSEGQLRRLVAQRLRETDPAPLRLDPTG